MQWKLENVNSLIYRNDIQYHRYVIYLLSIRPRAQIQFRDFFYRNVRLMEPWYVVASWSTPTHTRKQNGKCKQTNLMKTHTYAQSQKSSISPLNTCSLKLIGATMLFEPKYSMPWAMSMLFNQRSFTVCAFNCASLFFNSLYTINAKFRLNIMSLIVVWGGVTWCGENDMYIHCGCGAFWCYICGC